MNADESPPATAGQGQDDSETKDVLPQDAVDQLSASLDWMKMGMILVMLLAVLDAAKSAISVSAWWSVSAPVTWTIVAMAACKLGAAVVPLPSLWRSIQALSEAKRGGNKALLIPALEHHREFWARFAVALLALIGLLAAMPFLVGLFQTS